MITAIIAIACSILFFVFGRITGEVKGADDILRALRVAAYLHGKGSKEEASKILEQVNLLFKELK